MYYHGYVGSYKIEGNKDGNLVYARQPNTKVTDATKIMSRNENQSEREFGKPKKTHLLLQMNAGFAGVKTFEGTRDFAVGNHLTPFTAEEFGTRPSHHEEQDGRFLQDYGGDRMKIRFAFEE